MKKLIILLFLSILSIKSPLVVSDLVPNEASPLPGAGHKFFVPNYENYGKNRFRVVHDRIDDRYFLYVKKVKSNYNGARSI